MAVASLTPGHYVTAFTELVVVPILKRMKEIVNRPLSVKGEKVWAVIVKSVIALGVLVVALRLLLQILSPQLHWLVYVARGFPDAPKDFTGTWRTWGVDGKMRMEEQYVRGKLEGLWTLWSEEGRKLIVASFRDGMLHGTKTTFFTNGAVRANCDYVDGKPVGPCVEFFPDGRTSWYSFYSKPGIREGPQVRWTRDGERKVLRVWREGQPWDGKFYSTSNQNKILREYTNGVLISEVNLGPSMRARPHPASAPPPVKPVAP